MNFRRNNLDLLGWLKKDAGQGSWLPPQSLEIFIIFQSSVTEVIGNMTASHAIRVAEGEGGSLAPRADSSALFSALFWVVAISILFLTCWISRREKTNKQTTKKKMRVFESRFYTHSCVFKNKSQMLTSVCFSSCWNVLLRNPAVNYYQCLGMALESHRTSCWCSWRF